MCFRFYTLVAILLVATGISVAHGADKSVTVANSNVNEVLPLDDLQLFTKVFDHIRKAYVNPVTDKQLLESAVRGMLSDLDPHSNYLDEDSFRDLQVNTEGEFGGLGIEISSENGFVKVVTPIDGTPAASAGIMTGDLIIQLDKKSLKGFSLDEVIGMMRGSKGSSVILTIIREGSKQPLEITVIRDIIKVDSVRSEILEEGYAYIRIAQFQSKTGSEFTNMLTELAEKEHNLKGIVLDLRNNPGGLLKASIDVVDALLEKGLIVYTKGRLDNTTQRYDANPGDQSNGLPFVVLINDGSASASEIVAGALQDQGRAVIMGTRSFGKGSVQTVIPLSENKAIKLTTALYVTPSGRSIQAQGIEPDVIVERARFTNINTGLRIAEADLNGHLKNAEGAKEFTSADKLESSINPRLINDNQLYAALNLLKGLQVFSKDRVKSVITDPAE
jgi:carboxyl-terminal processing protease